MLSQLAGQGEAIRTLSSLLVNRAIAIRAPFWIEERPIDRFLRPSLWPLNCVLPTFFSVIELRLWLAGLEDDAFVAGAASGLFAVEVFEQGDGVLARDAGEIFEGGDIDQAIRFVSRGVRVQLPF